MEKKVAEKLDETVNLSDTEGAVSNHVSAEDIYAEYLHDVQNFPINYKSDTIISSKNTWTNKCKALLGKIYKYDKKTEQHIYEDSDDDIGDKLISIVYSETKDLREVFHNYFHCDYEYKVSIRKIFRIFYKYILFAISEFIAANI